MKQGRWPLSWASHMRAVALVLVALLCVGGFNPASADAAEPVSGLVTVPALSERVTDLTGTLDATQRGALEQKLKAFETARGAQVAVLLLPTTQPETIEQFSIRVMDAWKLGRKGVDDGVLLLVAKNDRRLRIEVGYGLEGALNDATAKRIIAEVITPKLKAGDFIGGIDTGVDAILKVVQGEPLPEPTPIEPLAFSAETLLILMGAAVMGGMFLRSVFGNFLGCSAVGTISGLIGLGWLDSWFGFGGGFIIGVLLAALGPTFLVQMTHGRGGRSGGSWGNSSGNFDGFGSGGGFGGFSGGGGMGGGGGASGSW